jgi:ribosome maturation factor RimP
MAGKRTEVFLDRVNALAGPIAEDLGLELADVVYTNLQGRWVLQVFIDKPGGVTLGDCGALSRELSTALDVDELMPERYSLEVSSPGLDRALKKEKDFLRFVGKKVRLRTKEPIGKSRNFSATIAGVEQGMVVMEDTDGRRWQVDFGNIEKANLIIEI